MMGFKDFFSRRLPSYEIHISDRLGNPQRSGPLDRRLAMCFIVESVNRGEKRKYMTYGEQQLSHEQVWELIVDAYIITMFLELLDGGTIEELEQKYPPDHPLVRKKIKEAGTRISRALGFP